MKAETREWFGIDGLKVSGITNGTGHELSYLPCRLWIGASAWIAQLFWWRYQYSSDLDMLREQAYPFMRDVAQFYRGYALMGDDGHYHIFPAVAPEQSPWWATDPAIDLALIRAHLNATLAAGSLLGVDAGLRAGWQDLLERLAPLHSDGEVILDYQGAPPNGRLAHVGLLTCTFTAGEIGLGSPPEQQALARRTLERVLTRSSHKVVDYPLPIPTWNDDVNWPAIVAYAARLGMGEAARTWLYDLGVFQHLKPNGTFCFDTPLTDEQREVRWWMPDTGTACTAAVSEMLLQSYEGAIRVAPAVPADWDAEFSGLLAMGAFEVGATIRGGRTQQISVHSLRGERCRIISPWPAWPAHQVQVRLYGEPVEYDVEAGGDAAGGTEQVITFSTTAGSRYVITTHSTEHAAPSISVSAERVATEPLQYVGPAYMGDVAESERMAVWLGLPAIATRSAPPAG
jgi:hypothetical protein